MAVDPQPFEPAFPDGVREAFEFGQVGLGAAADWVTAKYPRNQIDAALALLRTGPPELAGWCAGITMFGDKSRVIAGTIDRERLFATIPYILDAFAAGIAANVKPTKHQWGSIERLVTRNATAGPGFVALLPAAVCQEAPIAREHACRIAALLGDPAREVLTGALATAGPRERSRLEHALATFVTEPVDATAEAELLVRLLAAWRSTRDPALEPPIARLGRMLATMRGPLITKQQASYFEAEGIWHRRARDRDPADLDILLDVPLPWSGDVHARVELLAKGQPDPRLARLLDQALAYPNREANLFDRTVKALAFHFASPLLEPLFAAIQQRGPRHGAAIAAMREATRVPRPADPALLAEAEAATRARAQLDELYAQAARNADDLGLRAVLADALQAAGDPRGELITLQLAIAEGATDPKLHRRAAMLLDAHFATWTAELPSLSPTQSRFERGFLVRARYEGAQEGLELSAGRLIWHTIEELDVSLREATPGSVVCGAPRLRTITSSHDAPLLSLESGRVESGRLELVRPNARAIGCLYTGWLPNDRERWPDLAVVAGVWSGGDAVGEFRLAIRRAKELGLDALVWFDSVDFSSVDGTLELRFTLTRGRGGGFRPLGWAVRIPLTGPIQLAWSGPLDAPDFEPDLRSLIQHATRLNRGPCELYLPPGLTCPADLDVVPGQPIDLTAANRT